MLQVLVVISKVLLQKRDSGYAKVIHKKKELKKMDTKVSEISKIMGT